MWWLISPFGCNVLVSQLFSSAQSSCQKMLLLCTYALILNETIKQGSHSDWKTWKNGKAFSSQAFKSQGILNRLEKSENHSKYWEFQTNLISYFLVIFRWTVYYLPKWVRFSVQKITGEMKKKCWKSQGILSGRESGNHVKLILTLTYPNPNFNSVLWKSGAYVNGNSIPLEYWSIM